MTPTTITARLLWSTHANAGQRVAEVRVGDVVRYVESAGNPDGRRQIPGPNGEQRWTDEPLLFVLHGKPHNYALGPAPVGYNATRFGPGASLVFLRFDRAKTWCERWVPADVLAALLAPHRHGGVRGSSPTAPNMGPRVGVR